MTPFDNGYTMGRGIGTVVFLSAVLGFGAWLNETPADRTFLCLIRNFFGALAAIIVLGLGVYGLYQLFK